MLRLSNQHIDIPAGDSRYMVGDSFVLPTDVEVLAVQPHAHYLAREVTGLATLPDGTTRTLIPLLIGISGGSTFTVTRQRSRCREARR